MGHMVALIIWVTIFTAFYLYFNAHQEPKIAVAMEGLALGQVVIPRSRDGHYYIKGSINGYPIDFMVDTGASIVSVNTVFANEANLSSGLPASFSTAGGEIMGEIVPGQIVEAGGIVVNDLNVSVGIQSKTALLGQNFLRKVDIIQSNDTMILRIKIE
jgi:aspartyl protease family protein